MFPNSHQRTHRDQREPFHPSTDAATFRDLVRFEERLKMNYASLGRRKARYRLFLAELLLAIALLSSEVLLNTTFLTIPYNFLVRTTLPLTLSHSLHFDDSDHYDHWDPTRYTVEAFHPYVSSGLLTVAVITLVLFFASGMYEEKIGYANRYVPHANRALRNFNMHFNTRPPSLRSRLKWWKWSLIPFLSGGGTGTTVTASPPSSRFTSRNSSPERSPSPSSTSSSSSTSTTAPRPPTHRTRPRSPTSPLPIPPIPPSTNPRGELIFSSRVDRHFRESYEKFRAGFERKREERERERVRGVRGRGVLGRALGFLRWGREVENGLGLGSEGASASAQLAPYLRSLSPSNASSVSSSSRAGGSPSVSLNSTPSSSRRSSPVPDSGRVRMGMVSSPSEVGFGVSGTDERVEARRGTTSRRRSGRTGGRTKPDVSSLSS